MKAFLVFAVIFVSAFASPAQAADDDIIILDEDASVPQTAKNPYIDFLQRHFGAAGGGFWAGGGSFEQAFGFGSAKFDYPFKFLGRNGRVFVAGGYSYRDVDLELTFEPDFETEQECDADRAAGRPLGDDCDEEEFEISVSDSAAELREAYAEYEIIPDLIVSVGRQRPVWGQFDVFSVTNTLLPIEFQSREFGFDNTNLRMPQDAVIVSYFPTERIELSGYLFFETTLDPLLEKGLTGGTYNVLVNTRLAAGEKNTPIPSSNGLRGECRDSFANGEEISECDVAFSGDLDGADEIGYAFRALWRSDSFTVGFTFNQGHFSLNLFNRLPTVTSYCLEDNNPFADCARGTPLGYNVRERLALAETTSFAVELAVPINEWTLKGELAYMQSQSDIGVRSDTIRFVSDSPNPNEPPEVFAMRRAGELRSRENQTALFEWIINDNSGEGFVDVDMLLVQLGVDANYDRWHFGLSVLLFQTLLSDEADRANDLYKIAYPGNDSQLDEGDFDGIPLPTFYAFYDLGAEKEHRLGIAGGFLGVVAGVSVFYTGSKLFNEHLNWTASVDYTTSLANQLIADANENNRENGDSELSEDFSLSFRVGATFEF